MKETAVDDLRLALTLYGKDYQFTSVTTSDFNDPLTKDLFASPQNRGDGLVVTTGLTSAVTLSYTVYEVPWEVLQLLVKAFKSGERVAVKLIGNNSRESRRAVKCIIRTNPDNGTTQEGSEANAVALSLAVTRNNIKSDKLT